MNYPVLASLLLTVPLVCARAEPVAIPTTGLAAPRQPQVAVDRGGRAHVVVGDGNAIFVMSTGVGDLQFAPAVKIGAVPSKLALGMRRGPRIVAAGGNLVVTAISHEDGRVHGWRSTDGGKTWRAMEPINTVEKSAREGLHALASDGRGLVVCVWLDLRGGRMEPWCRVSRDGGETWQPEVRVYASPDGPICPCCMPNVAIGPRGEIAAMWRNALGGARDLWMATSADGGASFGAAQKLGEGTWKLQACPMDGGGLAFAADGSLLTAWRRERTVFTSGAIGAETQVAADAAQPFVVSNGATLATLWQKGGALWVRVSGGAERMLAASGHMASAAPAGAGFLAVWEEPHGQAVRLRVEKFE